MKLAVEKAYLLITTSCNTACRYCIVKKTDERMKPETMRRAVDMVLATHGSNKKIAIYGGEPLTAVPFVKRVINYVHEASRLTKKNAELFIYTNGYLLDESLSRYFLANNVKIVFSIDAARRLNKHKRMTPAQTGDFEKRIGIARNTLSILGSNRMCAAPVILPQELNLLMPVFRCLTEKVGFKVVKILPGLVRYRWEKDEIAGLDIELSRLRQHILKSISSGKQVYVDMVNEAMLRTVDNQGESICRLSVLEFYPDGSFGLSPCEFEAPPGLENVNEIDDFLLGTVDNPTNQNELWKKTRNIVHPKHSALLLYSMWAERFAKELVEGAKRDSRFEMYVKSARLLSFA